MSLTTSANSLLSASLGWRFTPVVPVAFSLLYWGITAWLLRRRVLGGSEAPIGFVEELPAATFFRPVKCGVPGLRDKAARLIESARPGDQVVFGVESDEDFAHCQASCDAAPCGIEVAVVACKPSPTPNPKIAKLIQLAPHARHERWIVTDSEALLDAAFMDAFRGEWEASGAAALTAGYRFAGATSWPQRLDHLPALLTLWPGLSVTEWASRSSPDGLGFTLGACTGIKRRDLEAIGNWESLGGYLAEDHRLGGMLAAARKPVRLSRNILTLDADPMGTAGASAWGDWMRHQHRVALTYRACNPQGALGMILTQGVPWSLALALLHPASALCWAEFVAVCVARVATARQNARLLQFPATALGILLASFAETAFWLAAWLPLPVRWGRRSLRIGSGGRILSITEKREPS